MAATPASSPNTFSPFKLWPRQRVPLVLQSEAAECGLACLAMVAGAHGLDTDLPSLRQRFELSSRGATLAQLMDIGEQMGLSNRAVRLELEELPELRTPCLLHWDLNHFVVLVQADARRITVHDPAMGERTLTLKEASPHFTGVALELAPAPGFRPRKERSDWKLRSLFKGQPGLWRAFSQMAVLSLVLEVFAILMPMLSQWVIDDVIVSRDTPLLAVLATSLGLLALMSLLTRLMRSWVVLGTSLSWKLNSSTQVFRHLIRLPLSYFDKRHTGDVMSRFASVDTIQDTLTSELVEAVLDGAVSLVTLGLMFAYSPKLAAIVLGVATLYLLVRLAVFGPFRRASEELIVREAQAQTFLMETLRGMNAIKFFSRPGWRVAGWMNQQASMVNARVKQERINLLHQGVNGMIGAIEQALVLYLAAQMIIAEQFSIGMLVAFMAYKGQFLQRANDLIERVISLRLLRLQGDRLADIVLTPTEPASPPQAGHRAGLQAGSPSGSPSSQAADQAPMTLSLRDVVFRYARDEAPVLDHVNLTLHTGQALAVLGPSGCGKSTLMKILCGQVTPESGEVLLNGVPMASLGAEAFRSVLGTVFQDDQLFSCSIHDNIAMNDAEASAEKVEAAAALACVHEDIARMPMGYQTLVGGMGATLSGGQKQRILLARALYKRPRFLLLDEYTSHLDFATEKRVQDAINALGCGRFIITHREHSLREGDEVRVLWQGQLVDPQHLAGPEDAPHAPQTPPQG
ncbi:peptidase domain-containing ABC transporter [Aquabacterium sp.]|uniref:peptidase domain-containing ABC transporter n=1 Tax=Aquabacterium TaxID=92793 RepID=UPI001DD04510|nr:peptidase domain-containing ABC transporter [Aquabacterium sp.]MBT9608679.1 peptidase domain-containing ABC transporter [Aquabacterium sp.]